MATSRVTLWTDDAVPAAGARAATTPETRGAVPRRGITKRALALALLVLVPVAACSSNQTAPWSTTFSCTTGTCTGSTPVIADAGMLMSQVDGFRLSICAESGQTLSGAGTLNAVWGNSLANLPFSNPALNQNVTASGVRCATVPDFVVSYVTSLPDYVWFTPVGVTVSGGTTITEYIYPHVER